MRTTIVTATAVIFTATNASAGFVHIDGRAAGGGFTHFPSGGTASWPPGSSIHVFAHSSIADADRQAIERGIHAWDKIMPDIHVDIKYVDTIPSDLKNAVVIDNAPPAGQIGYSLALSDAPGPDTHGSIIGGVIEYDSSVLGHPDLISNLFAHEFGHILGLDDSPDPKDPDGNRTEVMQQQTQDRIRNEPFIRPSEVDKSTAREFYTVTPAEPSSLILALLAVPLALGAAYRNRNRASGC